jgi:hypothetical protein
MLHFAGKPHGPSLSFLSCCGAFFSAGVAFFGASLAPEEGCAAASSLLPCSHANETLETRS